MEFLDATNINMYIAIILSLVNGLLMCFASYKFFQIIQLSGYKIKGYFLWLKDTKASYVSRMIFLSLLSSICVIVTNALFNVYHTEALYSYIGLIFYFYFTIVFIINLYSAPKKIPLKNTTRMTRLNVVMLIFVSIFSFFIIALCTEYLSFVKFGGLCFVPIFMPIIVPFVHMILIPFEKIIINGYIARAKYKLKKCPNLIKIGITGSFGKTSTKYILNSILSEKYKVCMSPHSFNTLPGLCKVVNNYLELDDKVLICEMGARNIGDIKKLCNLINPKYAIITGVGTQHMLTFKTKENILKAKFELVESLPSDGIAIFNSENNGSKELFLRCQVKKFLVGKKGEISAENIEIDENGTSFTLKIGKKEYPVKTKLLGSHFAENILLCVKMAKLLGLTDAQIVRGIEKLLPVPHRLELIKTPTNIILDDAYNASVEGSEMALSVLKKMKGRKIVITPGLVELGKLESLENFNFGKKMAKVADFVVIVNNLNFEDIKRGLNSENFGDDKIYQAEDLSKAKILMKDFVKEGDVILFENDLPDNYI
ncbi:MAG: UDP-N-acetylmuramoyl-tripeptide--D-alanyl-D-alanine ligase [Clostridia bacterium]|nr:UDP-N-acetylmuramoyl-tripeptide--D-alanyl-D-alanine ligase [Clostridia bacterium]